MQPMSAHDLQEAHRRYRASQEAPAVQPLSTLDAADEPLPAGALLLTIDAHGTITGLYDDALAGLLAEGTCVTRRASHVEPAESGPGWLADMSPVGGPVLTAANGQPFATRQAALDAEKEYIARYVL